MEAAAGKSVTVTLSSKTYDAYKTIVEIGDIIKVKRKKRLRLIVTGYRRESYGSVISTKKAYAPAPKSRLNRKSKFSKFKMKIIKLNTLNT